MFIKKQLFKEETIYNDLKLTTTRKFWDYFTIWDNPFFSYTFSIQHLIAIIYKLPCVFIMG